MKTYPLTVVDCQDMLNELFPDADHELVWEELNNSEFCFGTNDFTLLTSSQFYKATGLDPNLGDIRINIEG